MAQTKALLREYLIDDIAETVLSFFDDRSDRQIMSSGLWEYYDKIKNIGYALVYALDTNNIELLKLFMDKGPVDPNKLIWHAFRDGRKNIIDLLIEKGAYNFDNCLFHCSRACSNIEFIKLLIELGSTEFSDGLYGASNTGNIEIAKLMIEKGANNFDDALNGAAKNGQMAFANFMIEKGATNFDQALYGACQYNYVEIAKLMIEKGATSLLGGLSLSCSFDSPDTMLLMIEKGATECQTCHKTIEWHIADANKMKTLFGRHSAQLTE
jgi:ankyrin repeat protein